MHISQFHYVPLAPGPTAEAAEPIMRGQSPRHQRLAWPAQRQDAPCAAQTMLVCPAVLI
jgi:hypothetical protein